MSLSAADGAVLIAAAVQAAIRERASNRCISGIAAAVAGQVVTRISTGQAAARQQPAARTKERRRDPAEEADDPAELLASLRAHRRAVRAKKKERRRAAKLAAASAHVPSTDDIASRPAVEILESLAGAAGSCADLGGGPAAMPAPAPCAPLAVSPPDLPAGHIMTPAAAPAAVVEVSARSITSDVLSSVSDARPDPSLAAGSLASQGRQPMAALASSRRDSNAVAARQAVESRRQRRMGPDG